MSGGGHLKGLPVPEQECYVDRQGLAELMGLSVSMIDRMRAAGMPSETWGCRSRRFQPSVAMAWAREHGHDPGRDEAAA